jgi:hypothetical protein
MNKHAMRVHAMRIANSLANFDAEKFKNLREYVGDRRGKVTYGSGAAIYPELGKWSFVDLDPLLGSVDYFLVDDGARATWPIDFGMCLPTSGGTGLRGNLDWRIDYVRSATPKEARKMGAKVFSQKMMIKDQIDFYDGQFEYGSCMVALLGGKWVDALKGPISSRREMMGFRNGTDTRIPGNFGDVYAGAALRHRYEWSAIFSFPTGLNLRFGTTAQGALSLFKDRDLEDGALRRSPLLHWVARHWRRGKNTADSLREISRYLRGKEQIEWHGLPVTIIPSEFEMEQSFTVKSAA